MEVVVTHFWFPIQKIKKIQKNIFERKKKNIIIKRVRKGCWNAHKIARNWLRRIRNTRIEI